MTTGTDADGTETKQSGPSAGRREEDRERLAARLRCVQFVAMRRLDIGLKEAMMLALAEYERDLAAIAVKRMGLRP